MKQVYNERYQEGYVETTLDNGLKVVVWQKQDYAKSFFMMTTPLGGFDVKQASSNQQYQYPAGVAHFLEHKMFEDENGEDITNIFSSLGADVNAYTSYQETTYFFSTTQDVYKPLEVLLDFVQSLHISEESVEREKEIILQELNQYLKMPDTVLIYEFLKALYSKHPLKNEILGDEESIRSITLEDLNQAYENNYHPSRMILVAITKEDPNKIIDFVKANQAKKQFASIETINCVYDEEPCEVATKYVEKKMEVQSEKGAIGFKLKGIKDIKEKMKQEWAIKFLIDAYFTSLNPDYQNWIDKLIFKDYIAGEIDYGSYHGFLYFCCDSDKIDEFFKLVRDTLNEAKVKGINEDVLEQLKRRYYAQTLRTFHNFDDIAMMVYQSYFNGVDYFYETDLFAQITCDYILEAASRLDLTHECRVVIKPN